MKNIQDKFDVVVYMDEVGTIAVQPRASVSVISVTQTSMTWKISGLGYPAKNYEEFEIEVSGGGTTKYKSWTSSNSTYDTQVTVTGLTADTRYTGYVSAKYNGTWYTVGSASDYTDPIPVTPPTINSITISSITANSFYYKISSSLWDYFNVEVFKYGTTELVYASYRTTSTSGTVTGLAPNTQYKIQVSAFNDGGSDYDYEYVTTLSAPKLPDPSVSISPSINSATFSWSRPTGASILVCTVVNESTSAQINKNFDAYSSPQTITGLSPNQRYKVYFRYEPSSSSVDYSPSNTITTYFTTVQKPTFYWSTTPTSGRPFSISASDWRVLQDTINEWRKLKGLSTYSFTRPSSGSTFYASYFNEVRTAMSSISGISGLPSAVSSGSQCYASSFVALQTAINNLNI